MPIDGKFRISQYGLSDTPWLRGLEEAKKLFQLGVSRGYPIVIKGDPDVDGLLAYVIASQMLTQAGYKFRSMINTNRRHGLVEEEFTNRGVEDKKYVEQQFHKNELIINVDSSISGAEMQFLASHGNIVISLDHHEVEVHGYNSDAQLFYPYGETVEGFDNVVHGSNKDLPEHLCQEPFTGGGIGVIINNQYAFEREQDRYWSGTGVTLHGLSYILGISVKKEWLVMHGITLLSDVRDIENDLAREVLYLTYNTPLIECPTLKKLVVTCQKEAPELFKKNPEKLDRMFIDYNFSPYYNACYQLNLGIFLFRLVNGETTTYYPAKTARKNILAYMEKFIQITELPHLTLLILDLDDLGETAESQVYYFEYTNFIGLLANKYLDLGHTVLIGAVRGKKWLRGSVRGYLQTVNYQAIVANNGFECKGHKGAFGITAILSKPNFKGIDKQIAEAEEAHKNTLNVVGVKNLSKSQNELLKIADDNQYKLSQNYTYLKYKGLAFSISEQTKGTVTYTTDGMFIKSFDKDLDLRNALILPILDNGYLTLTLRKVN